MQASNFGGTFDQLFLRIFYINFHRRCLSTSSIPWCKKVKNDQKLKSRGGPALKNGGAGEREGGKGEGGKGEGGKGGGKWREGRGGSEGEGEEGGKGKT